MERSALLNVVKWVDTVEPGTSEWIAATLCSQSWLVSFWSEMSESFELTVLFLASLEPSLTTLTEEDLSWMVWRKKEFKKKSEQKKKKKIKWKELKDPFQ